MPSSGKNDPSQGSESRRMAYTPSNFDFLSIPMECGILDWGTHENAFLTNINRIYGMLSALSADIQTQDPILAYESVNAALVRFWLFHRLDLTIPSWTEAHCWKMAYRYWA